MGYSRRFRLLDELLASFKTRSGSNRRENSFDAKHSVRAAAAARQVVDFEGERVVFDVVVVGNVNDVNFLCAWWKVKEIPCGMETSEIKNAYFMFPAEIR